MEVPKPKLTEFGIHNRLETCVPFSTQSGKKTYSGFIVSFDKFNKDYPSKPSQRKAISTTASSTFLLLLYTKSTNNQQFTAECPSFYGTNFQ